MFLKLVLIAFLWAFARSQDTDLDLVEERAWTLCLDSLWNSCVGRCGRHLTGPPYLCGCDFMCLAYGDCCLDFQYECTWDSELNHTLRDNATQVFNSARMSCVGLSTTMEYGVLMISSCASWWPMPIVDETLRNTTRSRCLDLDTSSLKPVMGVNFGEIYKNVDCAHCNGVRNVVVWPFDVNCTTDTIDNGTFPWSHQSWLLSCTVEMDVETLEKSNARACAYEVGECPVTSSSDEDTSGQHPQLDKSKEIIDLELTQSCSSYSKPIMVMNEDQSMVTYKNVHCAQCNGHCIDNLYCPQWELQPRQPRLLLDSAQSVYYETGVTADTRRSTIPNLPAAFSILFYFHQNGFHLNMFSSYNENWKENCDENQIWDPFWETCRDVYCASQFTLENFHCVNNGNSNGGVPVSNSTYTNVTQFDNVDVSQVRLDMEIQLQVPVNSSVEEILEKEFIGALSQTFNITDNRFVNYTSYNKSFVNGSYTNQEEVSVILLGPLEPLDPTIEKIVGIIAYGVSLDQLWLELSKSGLVVKIFGIQEQIIQVTNSTDASNSTNTTSSSSEDWCEDGRQLVYQNDQFTPIVIPYSASNQSLNIYINSTGETYLPGQFIANILMTGYQGSTLVNVSGAVIICDESYHNDSCLRVMILRSDYRVFPNGTIEYIGNISEVSPNTYPPKEYEILPDGNALVCLSFGSQPPTLHFQLGSTYKDLKAQSLLTTILLTISSTTLILTIAHYGLFSSLRNLPGWTILNLCVSLLAFQLLYLGGMRFSVFLKHELCYGVAVFLHWSILSAFFWMNVIAFDLFWTFSQLLSKPGGSKRPLKTIFYYALYGYGMASLVVSVCVILDNFTSYNIGYATKGCCWIGDPKALAVVFAGVIGIVLLTNLIFYCLTVCSIRKMGSKIKINGASRSQMSVYIRMSALMGFTWALGYLEGVESFSYTLHDVFAYAFIVANCLAGVFIFAAMVCNRKSLLLYRDSRGIKWLVGYWNKTFVKVSVSRCDECKETTENCNCPKTVIRTISNETVQSVLEAEREELNLEINEVEPSNSIDSI